MASKRPLNPKEQARRFEEIFKNPINKECFDCTEKGPRWASTNLGIFLCLNCAGQHRQLGVHISKVKSVNMDKWEPEMMAFIEHVGNDKALSMYRPNVPPGWMKPAANCDSRARERAIRDTYEMKKFSASDLDARLRDIEGKVARGERPGAPVQEAPAPAAVPAAAPAPTPTPAPQPTPVPVAVAQPAPVQQQPAPVVHQPPPQAARPVDPFGNMVGAPPARQQQPQQLQQQPQQQPQAQPRQQPDIGNLIDLNSIPAGAKNDGGFSALTSSSAPAAQVNTAKSSVLDAFMASDPHAPPRTGGVPPIGGHPQQGGAPFMWNGGNGAPQQQQQQQPGNGFGGIPPIGGAQGMHMQMGGPGMGMGMGMQQQPGMMQQGRPMQGGLPPGVPPIGGGGGMQMQGGAPPGANGGGFGGAGFPGVPPIGQPNNQARGGYAGW